MTRRLLVVILTMILAATWGGVAAAGQMPYNLDRAEEGFIVPSKEEPNSGVVFLDAVIARPLGLITTAAGTTAFILTLPFTAPSRSVDTAARGLIGRPGGWTFDRPLGRSAPQYEEKNVFK